MAELVEMYADLPFGTVAAAERLGEANIATLDRRHFTSYGRRTSKHSRFSPDRPGSPAAPSTPHRRRATASEDKRKTPACRRFRDGSDGTRTRDLRRDRPVLALPD
jgi:hypothetical protein